jgi:glycosyltransferase involved in cell wall biosynthesis
VKLSIIIPTLNEARYLGRAVASARRATLGAPPEVIVADCGSVDGTVELAMSLGVCLARDQPSLDSRAAALNHGATQAGGDVLLFLDADSIVPRGYDRAMARALEDPQVVGGAFEFALDGPGFGLRVVEIINRVRYRIWPRYYGDQGLFVRRRVFERLKGFPRRRILEASDFSRALGRRGKVILLGGRMKTSPRRFLDGGIYRVLAQDVLIWWLDLIGRPTEKFATAYQKNNRRRGRLKDE